MTLILCCQAVLVVTIGCKLLSKTRLKEPKKKLRDKGTIAMGLLALTTSNLAVKRLQVMAVITSQVRVARRNQLRSAMPLLSRYQMKNRKCLHCVYMMLDSRYLLTTHLES